MGDGFPWKLDSDPPIGQASGALRLARRLVGAAGGLAGPTGRVVGLTGRVLSLERFFGRSPRHVLSLSRDVHGIPGL